MYLSSHIYFFLSTPNQRTIAERVRGEGERETEGNEQKKRL